MTEVKADLAIPDIWYDFYARLVPGAAFAFGMRFLYQGQWILPDATEALILTAAGYFVGLLSLPIGSTVAHALLSFVYRKDGKDGHAYVAGVQAKLNPESRRALVLSKMYAESVFFGQVTFLVAFLFAASLYWRADRAVSLVLVALAVYAPLGAWDAAKRRQGKAHEYDGPTSAAAVSREATSTKESAAS